ncbi:hypothetical protein [Rhodoferax sp. GW822-FHT02A01]|uniref:hypothetical protein n=1 Tax=Rhodoferax sp. GW822-FHT02A01 TaxID=3141537 RepID=UPI00315DEAF4
MTVIQGHSGWPGAPKDGPDLPVGGEPPYDGGMETRVAKLEDFAKDTSEKLVTIGERLVRIETRLDTFATKTDLHEMTAQMVKWIVGTAIGLGAAGITVMTFVLNNASPKASPQSQQAPIIINVPGAPAPQLNPPTPKR